MVKILKTPLPKHEETLSPWIKQFVQAASTTPLPLLPQQLAKFPSRWPFPRDDLYHWIPLLNRFDTVLEEFCTLYGLHDGPQTRDFTCELLERGLQGGQNLEELGYSSDGDRQVIESILDFSRMLLENCGNRTIYASSPLLSDLLNSTSLSLIASTLQIGTQLAQRYQASFKRMSVPYRQHNSALLAIHYNINLDRVQHLAQPFVRTTISSESIASTTPVTPSTKGKEKAYFSASAPSKSSASTVYANDLVSIARGGAALSGSPKVHKAATTSLQPSSAETTWDEWGDVRVSYYHNQSNPDQEIAAFQSSTASPSVPPTPTPIRRTSSLGQQHAQRSSRLSSTDESSSPMVRPPVALEDDSLTSKLQVLEIPKSKVASVSIHQLLKETLPSMLSEYRYELLTKLRVAKALMSSDETRRQILAVRILAITNLAYIHNESTFLEKVLKQDSDEPRRLQLIYQLADMIHPPAEGTVGIPRSLQTIALSGLDALAGYQSRFQDICIALNTNVNHGVLLYLVRKAVAEMSIDETGDYLTEKDEWRSAVFSLLSHVATLPRAGSDMVTAGLVPILIDVLKLRTSIAERNYPMILDFLDAFIFNVRDAFQILVGADGLDAISDLIVYEVKSASQNATAGQGMRSEYRSPSIDYEIPYFQQQSIKWLFKFIHHMMTTAGGYGGNFDRLLRNLIDSAQLLGSLREIISAPCCFGSTVWTNAVKILNDFINNEPTSFAVIAEAGLSRAFLESVTGKEIKMPEEPKDSQTQIESANDASSPAHTDDESISVISALMADETPHPPTAEMLEAHQDGPLAHGILPSAEAITIIPAAFGAICLNAAGMRMFQSSNALQSFFEVFESPKHVQCMENDLNLASNLGATFDELVRHHPSLKTAILNATLDMVARVAHLCKRMASADNAGAKLWKTDVSGRTVVADDSLHHTSSNSSRESKGKGRATSTSTDVEMSGIANEAAQSEEDQSSTERTVNTSPAPYIYVVATFLSTMFSNAAVRIAFMEKGGNEYVLDLAELPSLPYDFADDKASRTLHTVIALLAEQKPHLLLPSLLKRAQSAAGALTPFTRHKSDKAYFEPLVSGSPINSDDYETVDRMANGTRLAKALVNVHSLTTALHQCFQTPVYNHRTPVSAFNQINLTDYYVQYVKCLGPLLAAAIREDFILQKGDLVPGHWRQATRTKASPFANNDLIDDLIAAEPPEVVTDAPTGTETMAVDSGATETTALAQSLEKSTSSSADAQVMTKRERESARFKNFQTLRYLLSKIPPTVSAFFQGLGKVLLSKRNPEAFQRQSHMSIADAIAETVLQLSLSDNEATIENYNYWIVMIQTVKDILISISRHSDRPFECATLVLQAFKERNGFDALNHLLDVFTEDIRQYDSKGNTENKTTHLSEKLKLDLKLHLATLGTKHILNLYLLLVTGKNIIEAPQTAAMISRSERDRSRNEHFSTGQFLVELRMAVLPTVRRLWESDLVEKASNEVPNRLIDIIRTIAVADHEQGAHKRSDRTQVPGKISQKPWKVNVENVAKLTDAGFDEDLAKEALFRCNNSHALAWEYCKAQSQERSGGRNPIPQDDIDNSAEANGSSRAHTGASSGISTPVIADPPAMQLDESVNETSASSRASNQEMGPPPIPNDPLAMSLNSLLNGIGRTQEDATAANNTGSTRTTPPSPSQQSIMADAANHTSVVTVEDLNEERAAIRERLIERCLDVINAHGDVTWEVSDLITTVVDKSDDPPSMRKDIGETLVNVLISLEGDMRVVGKKVAAYAHLLALMLRNKSFYTASIGALKGNLPTLLEFIKLSPTHSSEESSPWIAQVLLIMEDLLSEDAQPYETEWKFPTADTAVIDKPVLKLTDPVVSTVERNVLFHQILEILPRIGKDEVLALAVLRVLVILTRTRTLALAMGEKKNIQRLFVMAKQLAGATSSHLQGPLMLILRHIIEDDETIKQIMRSEVKAFFEVPRPQRHIDVSTYIRQLSHLVIRAPVLFVEVTNEMVKLSKWSSNASDSPGRQQIVLQEIYQRPNRSHPDDKVLPPLQATGLLSIQDVKPTTEAVDKVSAEIPKPAHVEHKAPVLENPDGVIHFLLCELLNYKDVDDKDPAIQSPEKPIPETSSGNVDAAMMDMSSPTDASTPSDAKDSKKPAKHEFKAEEHPIYIYRCFLLQCLTELLSCYNRTKIEFINFKRSAPPQAMTPSKPRSSVVNYLLSDLIPVGTLDHGETTLLRKKLATSSWADSVLTALLSKTGEQIMDRDRDPTDSEDEPDLLFVRKFVLENILKAYKDAGVSSEPLDVKYSRMLSLADLMSHIMASKENHSNATDPAVTTRSSLQLRRIMFDKGFIAALTGSIADIDLNHPGAKRAVKHILRPLKVLTQTAIDLSDAGKISTVGQTDDDEIVSASSVSDLDDAREETPDLFRNSTLGMFEPGRDHDSSSESEDDDEEMYEEEYDDEEMEYEEEMAEDEEDNISDEDEELEGMGEIEGLSGDRGVNVEVIMEGEDDDDDDDDDDDEEPSDEDDEGDSDDIDDDEDAHVEIVDEDGNTHPLGEGDDGDEWQSEDDEEEEYEGRAADEEEERNHEIGHIARGAIGHLVRALGGDDHEGAVEILQRMEDEGIEEQQMELEGYLEDGQDEEEDEEDDDDMDDDDGMYDEYPGAPPGMGFEWNGEAVEPQLPMIISHRGHHHRPRGHGIPSPFGYFPTSARDTLGGTLNPLPELQSLLHTRSLAVAGLGLAQTALSMARSEAESGDDVGAALSTARSALQEARLRLAALQGLLSGDVTVPANFNTNAPPVPDVHRGFPPYRSHRPGPTPRGNDDGTNPLLQRAVGNSIVRDGSIRSGAMATSGDGIINIGLGGQGPFGEGPAALLNDLITSLPLPGSIVSRHGHAFHFHVTGGPRSEMGRDLQALFGMTRGLTRLDGRREPTVEPGNVASFNIRSTSTRWTEEAKILFGSAHPDKAYQRVLPAVMAVLIPPALKSDMEARKVAEEIKKKRDEEERLAKEKKEAEEKAAKEKKEAEEREAAERARAEELAAADTSTTGDIVEEEPAEANNAQAMEGVETTEDNANPAATEEAGPAGDRPRVLTMIRGNQIDITDLGIDADFLQELPEDIREEVITNAVADRRSQAAAAGAEPSEIDQEFLDALPSEIRDEIIQQERQDRRRREREEQRRQAAANGSAVPVAAPQEMDAASILATLPPALRQQVLMEQDDEILAHLPPEFIAQARAGMRDLPLSHVRNMAGGRPRTVAALSSERSLQKPQRRSIVQMVDKAGVATLLRLMFVSQQDSLRQTLYYVLQNISENRHNRSEVISTLLHILQDGSTDITAVERSFAHLSLRAKQPKEKEPKTLQLLKRTLTGVTLNIFTNTDITPLMVVQQCLGTLIHLSKVNFHVPSFFLTEHESVGGLKRSSSRKGKAKDTRASKYALNSLLTLLDRKLIMESSSVMESLSDLLSRITAPLQALERKQKEAAEEANKAGAEPPTADTALSVATPETATANEQPAEPMDTDRDTAAVSAEPTASPTMEVGDASAPVAQSDKPAATDSKDNEQKKLRPFVPPVIPESNLKLVINIFVARECSAKTFRETLSTIKNLSCIPGAKAVFGRELIRKAQELGEVILLDLDELLPQIQKASTGTEIQGVALAKFSPSGSDQNKLLRVLTALDHLFDPKNGAKKDTPDGKNTKTAGEQSKEVDKQDLLATLYENSTFGPMWEKLSACLSAIRQREHMLNVATILLPLIESLMVVCKNTTLKDSPISRSQIGKETNLTSPPESRMENLFFTFTEEHRKILNDLVRHTPKLMSGTFSLLVKNPKVLEFDNKRNYFTRSIHNRNSQTRQSFPPLQLSVRRDQVFHDSFKSLYFKSGDEMKFGKLSIRFHGEEGVDAGGVTREWFQVLSRQMFDPGYALFIPVSSDRTTFHPNHMSGINPEHLMFFKFIGRVIGKALYEGRVLDCHFSRAVYKRILGKSVSVKDMESLDPDYYKSLVWMLENDITDIITETFSVDNDKFGVVETVDLIPSGRNIPVTQENKQEYIRLMVEFKLTGSVRDQLDNFLKGFHEIIPAELVAIFNEQELELLISGLPEIDVDDWKSNTEYHNYTGASPQIQWFWRAVRSFDKEERAKLLQFVTGTSKVPLNGFKELEGMNGFSRFNIHRDYGNKDRLPSSHTCFNQLDLPEYEGYEVLRQQVLTAITAGSEYFGFA